MDTGLDDARREVSPLIARMVLRYVDRALGIDAADRVARAIGEEVTYADLRDPNRWYSSAEVIALTRAAGELTGDREFGRRIGEELFRYLVESGWIDFIKAEGTVPAATASALEFGSKMSSGRLLALLDAADDHLTFSARFAVVAGTAPPAGARLFCDLLTGFYAQLPSVFGYLGTAVETACQVEGADRCEYRMAWRPDPRVETPGAVDATASARRTEEGIARFEAMQQMATDMVAVDDVDGVLQRIIGHVSQALAAPQYLLAVDAGDGRRRVHSVGFTAAAADAFAGALLAGAPTRSGIASVPIRSGDREFGRLAAAFAVGATVSDVDERLLSAYATHAAAALNVIASLQAARYDRDTAQALLGLAHSLASVGTSTDVATRICDAIPRVVRCDRASLYLYDADADALVRTAAAAVPGATAAREVRVLAATSLPGITAMANDPRPLMIDVHQASPLLRETFDAYGLTQVAVAPIQARGAFLGVVTAGFTTENEVAPDDEHDLFHRLSGLADHAATALENAKLLDQMRHEALHDSITGLPNRMLIEERGRQAFAHAARSDRRVGLLFIDLDRFKNVNDTLGHHAGDQLIKAVAERLESTMRPSDTLARLGGDEFVVLLPDVGDADQCVVVANRLLETLREPFEVCDQELFISCSIGIACSPEHGSSYESLLRYADSAMYSAKNHGRGTFAVDAAATATPRRQRLRLESQLHRALENEELRVHYQPLIELATCRVVGAEALVRWQHPTGGLLLPSSFLPLAEESGLVTAMDEWVRGQAFTQARAWQDEGRDLRVTVNVGARTLTNPDLASIIERELVASGANRTLIELEINENVAMSDVDELPIALEQLRRLGVRIAIDDFGTGSSVLRRLQNCEIDTLKIDRSFIASVTERSVEVPLIKALLAMAMSLELTVVAEGVETAAQAEILSRYGCELVQGYLFGRAVPAAAFGQRYGRVPVAALAG